MSIDLHVTDTIAVITINKPATLNALDIAALNDLQSVFSDASHNKAVHAIVFTGAGKKAFVAGGDIADLNSRNGLQHYLEFAETIHRVFRGIEASDKPTIAAINGWALGGGLELLLCTDIRFAARSAKIGLPEITLGLFPGAGGSQRLSRQITPCQAKAMIFSGTPITAEQAERIGLINKVIDDEHVLDEALAFARTLAQKSPLTLKLLKRALLDGAEMPLGVSLRHEQALIGLVLDSQDAHEGCAAFLEKRAPTFRGA
jgi:enoyl-CoA hydratase